MLQSTAQAKLEKIGIYDYFRLGSYGECSTERMDLLPPLLQEVQTTIPDLSYKRTVIIGDTPMDIAVAHRYACFSVAVACGTYSREQLLQEKPDHIIDTWNDMDDLKPILQKMAAS